MSARCYSSRSEAGRDLAAALAPFAGRPEVVVLALPRGGVPVGFEVAEALDAPLDVYVVRKLGVPGHEELAMGAVASGGVRVLNDEVIWTCGVCDDVVEAISAAEWREVGWRERELRGGRPMAAVSGHKAILVDDGMATGATMRAAVAAVRMLGPESVVAAVPVASTEACAAVSREADQVVCLSTPEPFFAVGAWYLDFTQTTDEEVRGFLERADRRLRGAGRRSTSRGSSHP